VYTPEKQGYAHIYFRAVCPQVADMYIHYLRAGRCMKMSTGMVLETRSGCAQQSERERECSERKMVQHDQWLHQNYSTLGYLRMALINMYQPQKNGTPTLNQKGPLL
jgi:hypothetical protein